MSPTITNQILKETFLVIVFMGIGLYPFGLYPGSLCE